MRDSSCRRSRYRRAREKTAAQRIMLVCSWRAIEVPARAPARKLRALRFGHRLCRGALGQRSKQIARYARYRTERLKTARPAG
jgi:hypothetical protein